MHATHKMLRVGQAKDLDLRPWTLDNTLDVSLQKKCHELDQALERTSPFKKGGDFQYSKGFTVEDSKYDINSIKTIKRAVSASRTPAVSQRATTPAIPSVLLNNNESEDEEVYTQIIDIAYPDDVPNSRHSVKRFIRSPPVLLHKSSSEVKQTNVYGNSRRKAPMRNKTHKPDQKYQTYINKQVCIIFHYLVFM